MIDRIARSPRGGVSKRSDPDVALSLTPAVRIPVYVLQRLALERWTHFLLVDFAQRLAPLFLFLLCSIGSKVLFLTLRSAPSLLLSCLSP